MGEDGVPVTVEFGGGTELLLAPPHAKVHTLTVQGDAGRAPDMRALVHHIRTHLLHEREELFVEHDAVDWELEGEMDYVLQPKDHIVFISTLHGG
ncbi:hypothetical protein CBS9595_000250 [Malassezia furfur]|nr:hypothetical protein CBS9595_000250 [Malassezia furfur]